MWRSGSPGILLAVDNRYPWIGEVEAAVLVDGGYVWRCGDIECEVTNYGAVG